jgi:hypothetical protein
MPGHDDAFSSGGYLAMRKPFLQYLASDGVAMHCGKTFGTITYMREAII